MRCGECMGFQDVEILGGLSSPTLIINYRLKDVSNPLLGGEICSDCCAPGAMNCVVECDEGLIDFNGSSPITDCEYDGQTICVFRDTDTRSMACVNGRCAANSPTPRCRHLRRRSRSQPPRLRRHPAAPQPRSAAPNASTEHRQVTAHSG